MNGRQKLVVVCGILAAALMVLLPPWSRHVAGLGTELGPGGYHLVFAPPRPDAESMVPDGNGVWRDTEELRIDVERLLFQLGIAGVVTLFLGDRAGRPPDRPEPETWTYHRSRNFDADE